ncbi:MAG: hypothetical protein AMXMBFR53_25680 [Gemmatimonadota bacterium]
MPFIREGALPEILCGPILRTVTPTSVSVFLVTSVPADVRLRVLERAGVVGAYQQRGEASRHTEPLGPRLHLLVIRAEIPEPWLVAGTLYHYDIELTYGTADGATPPETVTKSLADLNLLSGEYALGYDEGALPSFALPPGLAHLNLVHGSCRKPHGGGERDMLAVVDAMVAATRSEPLARPHQLLLTGDQIYADDVAPCLLASLTRTAEHLTGWSALETIPFGATFSESLPPGDPRLTPGPSRESIDRHHAPVPPTTSASRGGFADFRTRLEYVWSQTDLSSLEADAHLLFLGEYLAMYLFAWSDELWPRGDTIVPPNAEGLTEHAYTLPTTWEMSASWPAEEDEDDATRRRIYLLAAVESREAALRFAHTLPRVRRALANVPTYMIFDDHEVTDDWNLHRAWRENVLANPAGKQVVRNALVAYALFQDWGNQPTNYLAGPGRRLLDACVTTPTRAVPLLVGEPDRLDMELSIVPATPASGDCMTWDHVAYGAEHQIIFLDCRTWRQYDEQAGSTAPAALIHQDVIDLQFDSERLVPNAFTFVVAPAPVLGSKLAETGQGAVVWWSRSEGGITEYDRETWAANEDGLWVLLERLLPFRVVVLLSGDVHYAFAKDAEFRRSGGGAFNTARLVQFVATSLRNEDRKTRGLSAASVAATHEEDEPWFFAGRGAELAVLLDQHFHGALPDALQSNDRVYADRVWQAYKDVRRARILGEPLSVPGYEDNVFAEARLLIEQYRYAYVGYWDYEVRGLRLENAQPLGWDLAPVSHPGPVDPPVVPGTSTGVLVVPNQVVGNSNIARVTFRMAGAASRVVQTLYWHSDWNPALPLISAEQSASIYPPT